MNVRTSLARFTAVSAAAAVVLALAACGGGSGTAETSAPAASTTAGTSGTSTAPDRRAAADCSTYGDACKTKTVTIKNNLPYGVLIKDVFGVDNNDWGSSRRPDHAPAEGLEGQYMNPGTQVTRVFDINANNFVVPFGLVIVDGSNHGRQVAHVEFDIASRWDTDTHCGWTFRDLAESTSHYDLCGGTATRPTPEGIKITVTTGTNSDRIPTTIVLG